jgi:hypothetical protein
VLENKQIFTYEDVSILPYLAFLTKEFIMSKHFLISLILCTCQLASVLASAIDSDDEYDDAFTPTRQCAISEMSEEQALAFAMRESMMDARARADAINPFYDPDAPTVVSKKPDKRANSQNQKQKFDDLEMLVSEKITAEFMEMLDQVKREYVFRGFSLLTIESQFRALRTKIESEQKSVNKAALTHLQEKQNFQHIQTHYDGLCLDFYMNPVVQIKLEACAERLFKQYNVDLADMTEFLNNFIPNYKPTHKIDAKLNNS